MFHRNTRYPVAALGATTTMPPGQKADPALSCCGPGPEQQFDPACLLWARALLPSHAGTHAQQAHAAGRPPQAMRRAIARCSLVALGAASTTRPSLACAATASMTLTSTSFSPFATRIAIEL